MVKKIKFKISKDGEISLDVDGAEGSSCEELTKVFEEKFDEIINKKYKPCYFSDVLEEQDETVQR